MEDKIQITRREFIRNTLIFSLVPPLVSGCGHSKLAARSNNDEEFNVWVSITGDQAFEFGVSWAEMGQHTWHGCCMLMAEELEIPFEWIKKIKDMPQELRKDTGGSSSIRSGMKNILLVAANTREIFKIAACRYWKLLDTDKELVKIVNGYFHWNTHRVSYFSLLPIAKKLDLTSVQVSLKKIKDYKIIGNSFPRIIDYKKLEGGFVYGMDIDFTDKKMYYGVINHPEHLYQNYGKIENSEKIKNTSGVIDIIFNKRACAVIATDSHISEKMGEMLEVKWEIDSILKEKITLEDKFVEKIDYDYKVPFLAQAPLGVICATIFYDKKENLWHIWAETQSPNSAIKKLKNSGFQNVKLHSCLISGGFGRKLEVDYILLACELVKQGKFTNPVQFKWSRESDMVNGFFRPESFIKFDNSWGCKLYTSSIEAFLNPTRKENPNTIDFSVTMCLNDLPYELPELKVNFIPINTHIPVGYLRSVGGTQNTFFVESMINNLAKKMGQDPLEYRLNLTKKNVRSYQVLKKLKKVSSWKNTKNQGVAFCHSFGSFVGMVTHLDPLKTNENEIKIEKIDVVVDAGLIIDPQAVIDQIQGGVIFGLGNCLYQKVTIKDGKVKERNFDDYKMIMMQDTPEINVYFVEYPADRDVPHSGGVGEISVPPVAPSVVHAYSKIMNKKVTSLPIL